MVGIKRKTKLVGIFEGVNPKVSPINNVIIKFSDKMFCLKKKILKPRLLFSCYYISKDKIPAASFYNFI